MGGKVEEAKELSKMLLFWSPNGLVPCNNTVGWYAITHYHQEVKIIYVEHVATFNP
jgi:hypothetical protein